MTAAGAGAGRSASRGPGHRERGGALIAVLFVVLLCELAILLVATDVHQLARRVTLDRDQAAASRLAESGLEHVLALLAADPALPGRLSAELAEGRYEVTVRGGAGEAILIVCEGRSISGRRVSLRLRGELRGGVVTVLSRDWHHDAG